jgi:hypothetical protein
MVSAVGISADGAGAQGTGRDTEALRRDQCCQRADRQSAASSVRHAIVGFWRIRRRCAEREAQGWPRREHTGPPGFCRYLGLASSANERTLSLRAPPLHGHAMHLFIRHANQFRASTDVDGAGMAVETP